MAYEGTNDEGEHFRGGEPSPQEKQVGEAQEEETVEEWGDTDGKDVWDL